MANPIEIFIHFFPAHSAFAQLGLIAFSLLLLLGGAHFTLEASEVLGLRLKIPKVLVGIILIGFGTSLPELFVSHMASLKGNVSMGLGNIIGSNVANLGFVLGPSLLITSLALKKDQHLFYTLSHLCLCLLLALLEVSLGLIHPVSGCLLLGFFVVYLCFIFQRIQNKYKQQDTVLESLGEEVEEVTKTHQKSSVALLLSKILLGVFFLYAGGEVLIESGKNLCLKWGVSSYAMASIVFAMGTSFPELVTSLLACYKKKDVDLILGNVLGSNIFNASLILGSIGFYKIDQPISLNLELTLLLMLGFAFWLLALKSQKIYRKAGLFLFSLFLSMVYYWSL